MKLLHTCEKCGKEIYRTKETNLEEIKCPHCNRVYVLDKKTDKWVTGLIVVLIIVLAILATFVQQKFNISFLVVIIPMILFGLFARGLVIKFLLVINKLNYRLQGSHEA